jgi:CRISPR-associated protein Cas5h
MAQESLSRWLDEGSGLVGESCLSFTLSGPWAHFRRVEGNIVKQTYRVIPRTTVAGLLAAVMGIGRNEYYDLFGPDVSAVSIEPVTDLRTMNMPTNTLSTAYENITKVPKRGRKLRIGLPDPTAPRQQHNYEVLVDPAYRIDLWLEDEQRYQELRRRLRSGESYYVPSLGLSEHLARIEYHGEFEVGSADDEKTVDSVVPGDTESVVPQEDTHHRVERSPAFMTADEGGRTTSEFRSYAYAPDASSLRVKGIVPHRVDGRTVLFT